MYAYVVCFCILHADHRARVVVEELLVLVLVLEKVVVEDVNLRWLRVAP